MIIRFEGERIGLAVDRIADVVRTTTDAIDELPANFDSLDTRFLQGVYAMENELLLVLERPGGPVAAVTRPPRDAAGSVPFRNRILPFSHPP